MAAKPSGLGRGLDALLAEVTQLSAVKMPHENHHDSQQVFRYLPLEQLQAGKYQPRGNIDPASIETLAASIKAQGIIQPLIVRNLAADCYEIIAGERRWHAAKIAGLLEVPVVIHEVADETALAFALIENIQREDLNPIDQALALMRLKDEFLMTHEKIAEIVGRSRSAVTNLMRLLTLDTEIKLLLQHGKLEMGHARALLTLNEEQQRVVAHQIVEHHLSVREAENLIRNIKVVPAPRELLDPALSQATKQWSEILSEKLSSPVKIQLNSKGEGRVIIQVRSPEAVQWLIDHLDTD